MLSIFSELCYNSVEMTKTDKPAESIEVVVEPRVKRKYTKRAKMLLRSNNDYIDHTYWPKMYAAAKKRDKKLRLEHPERYVRIIQPTVVILGPTITRKITPEQIKQMELDSCAVYGIKCIKHDMYHTPASVPVHSTNITV